MRVFRFLGSATNIRGTPGYVRDWITFSRLNRSPSDWTATKINPYLKDKYSNAGVASGHYFHQDLLVARRIHDRDPVRHIDVGSRIDGFVAHVASFRQIEVADIRPVATKIPNITFIQMDLMAPLADRYRATCDSLSCLHALEHFGLGRYGDPIDPAGHVKGLANLSSMLKPDGRLYLSVPIGPQRVEFNSQRVFAVSHLLDLIDRNNLEIDAFSYVNDKGDLIENVPLSSALIEANCGVRYGCGIFELSKKASSPSVAAGPRQQSN